MVANFLEIRSLGDTIRQIRAGSAGFSEYIQVQGKAFRKLQEYHFGSSKVFSSDWNWILIPSFVMTLCLMGLISTYPDLWMMKILNCNWNTFLLDHPKYVATIQNINIRSIIYLQNFKVSRKTSLCQLRSQWYMAYTHTRISRQQHV